MTELNYSDESKAIAHDQDRYVWEHESGFAYAGFNEGFTFDHSDLAKAQSEGYEQGFSRGWDAAMNRNWITRLINKINKKENN